MEDDFKRAANEEELESMRQMLRRDLEGRRFRLIDRVGI